MPENYGLSRDTQLWLDAEKHIEHAIARMLFPSEIETWRKLRLPLAVQSAAAREKAEEN